MSYLQPELPPIALLRSDAEKLARLADHARGEFERAGDFLSREIDRADIIDDFQRLPGLVTMGSRVTFRDDVTSQVRTVTLVFPDEADLAQSKISVLTPIGAALIGLSVNQSIEWETVSGGRRSLTVLSVDSMN
ncbi:nucleoside diphosphate kinase regulator [Pseudorhodoplanes sp.]|jgi:regulator of nucleoside diphosphate kinase|uniref:nucleoside diphosphate kinase regulator n=1 Tax=Pseudorhodoplanes sp. TaxID=1934341 RepID=UPI002CA5A318|nr:nucleoside diphosphate kinase regulator [Pseudorhodoplanes sp.]HWV42700.1 nucleoside diphosphate kinase regulator [Pseudorhodoplanes sp.]